jgi:hypothetical protein
MATIEGDVTATKQLRFCPECGHPAGEGRFCSVCGHSLDSFSEPPAGKHSSSPARSRGALIAAGAAVGLAAVAVAAIILLTGGSSSTPTSNPGSAGYQQKLAAALAPVVAADQKLSGTLTSLDGSPPALKAAQNAVSQAESALVAAHGALSVLTVPGAASTLSQQAQQALTAVSGYDQAVSATLSTPVGQNSSQLQTLATGAQSALVAITPVVAGAGTSLTGTDNLLGWVNGANALAQRQSAAAQHRSQQAQQRAVQQAVGSAASSSGGGGAAASLTGGTDCGSGLTAGPNTSCSFAENVQQAWDAAPGQTATVTAYSPVTSQSYAMSCGPDQAGGILCTGVGADNSVWWG